MCRRIAFAGFIPAGGGGAERRGARHAERNLGGWPGQRTGKGETQAMAEASYILMLQAGDQAAERVEYEEPRLGLDAKSTVLLFLSLIVSAQTLANGRTTVLQGVIHLVLFAIYLFTTFVP